MWWKIALAVVMVWLCFGLVVALAKGVLALAVVGLVALGIMAVVRALSGSDKELLSGAAKVDAPVDEPRI